MLSANQLCVKRTLVLLLCLYITHSFHIINPKSMRRSHLYPIPSETRKSHDSVPGNSYTAPGYIPSGNIPRGPACAPVSIMTLSRFMIEATRSNPDHADFESLMASIQIACKTIANLVSRAGISDLTGLQSSSSKSFSGKFERTYSTA